MNPVVMRGMLLKLAHEPPPNIVNQGKTLRHAQIPQLFIAHLADPLAERFQGSDPSLFPADLRPQGIGGWSIPGRHIHPVRKMAQGMNALFPLENEGEIAALYCVVFLFIFAQMWRHLERG
ncbi:MAG: hypothetical protein ABI856_10980 [Nitrospira sp.]